MLLVTHFSSPLAGSVSLSAGLASLCADVSTLSRVPTRNCWYGKALGVLTAVGWSVAYVTNISLDRSNAFAEKLDHEMWNGFNGSVYKQ